MTNDDSPRFAVALLLSSSVGAHATPSTFNTQPSHPAECELLECSTVIRLRAFGTAIAFDTKGDRGSQERGYGNAPDVRDFVRDRGHLPDLEFMAKNWQPCEIRFRIEAYETDAIRFTESRKRSKTSLLAGAYGIHS